MEGPAGPGSAWLEADDERDEGSEEDEVEGAEVHRALAGGRKALDGCQRRVKGRLLESEGDRNVQGGEGRAVAWDGSAGGQAPANKRRKKKKATGPRVQVPHFICEILQWAHSIMIIKWAFLSITVDGLYASSVGFVGCMCFGTIVLDWFKDDNGLGVGTLTNSYTILRLSIGLTNIFTFVGEALRQDILASPVFAAALSLVIVTTIVVTTSAASPSAHYTAVILWELVVLPAAAVVEASQGFGPRYVDVLLEHRHWWYGLVTAILLHPLDPMNFRWRTGDFFMNNNLRVPWDPVIY